MKAKNQHRRAIDNIRFGIGPKLITIISIIVIFSLGSITILVSWLIRTDLEVSAKENNFEANRRSAMEAESLLINARSNSRILMQTITAVGTESNIAREAIDFFFAENPQIAAVFYNIPPNQERLLISDRFFTANDIDTALANSYIQGQRLALGRSARGETILLNASPHFSRAILALFFPWRDGGVGGVLFSSEDLNNNFGFGINKSFMINSYADVLSHSDFTLARSGTNIKNQDFIQKIIASPDKNKQELVVSDFAFMSPPGGYTTGGFFSSTWKGIKRGTLFVFDKTAEGYNYLLYLTGVNSSMPAQTARVDESEGKISQFVAFTKLNTAGVIVITNIEYNKVFEGIAATTRRNIYLTISVLSISIIFIWFFSKSMSFPLKALALAARNIEGGSFEVNLRHKSKDELGVLTQSFQKMSKALGVFGRFTNKDIAIKAMRGQIKPGGFPKHATVFFSDIREFTAKSEGFTNIFGDEASDKIVHWLNNYFTQMVDCVEKTKGVVDKFIGDAVMAHWGTAYSDGSPRKDAFNCVKASLMMREALYVLNKDRHPGNRANPAIRIGCGINTGIVTAGQIGSDVRMEYTVIGDPVNLASRLEALNKPLGTDILISEDTWRLVGDKFVTEEMPSVTVKGKEKPVRVFAVINFAGNDKGPKTLSHVRSLLGIKPPDMSKVDVNADEQKFKIGE